MNLLMSNQLQLLSEGLPTFSTDIVSLQYEVLGMQAVLIFLSVFHIQYMYSFSLV